MGEEGNADVLLVHSPAAEKTFMEGGFGVDRPLVMHNRSWWSARRPTLPGSRA